MNILFIRTKYDAYTKSAFKAAQKIIDKLNTNNINFVEIKERDVTKQKVENAFNNIDFAIIYSHGKTDALLGHHDKPIIDSANVSQLLKNNGVNVSTVSCLSASQLGLQSINNAGTNAYLGYKETIGFPKEKSIFFDGMTEAYNTPTFSLLSGKTFQQAYTEGKQLFIQKQQEVQAMNDPKIDERERAFVLRYIAMALNAFTLRGNGNAKV